MIYVGTLKGLGRIYQQTYVDTYSKHALCKLYTMRNALAAADMLNDRVIPFYEAQKIPVLRILTDRGTEFCGSAERISNLNCVWAASDSLAARS